jgi:hypothetical protein
VSRLLLCLFAALSLACQPGGEPAVANAQVAAPQTPDRGASVTPEVSLEFDLPAEYASGDGVNAITGFRVGYFGDESSTPFHTIEIERRAMTLRGASGRVTVPSQAVPSGVTRVVLRVQTVAGSVASAWSDPSPVVTSGAARAPAKREARAPRGRRTLQPADLEPHQALTEALKKVMAADAKIEDAITPFRRVDDLALAIVISRDHDIPFASLAAAVAGPPALNLRNAVTKVRPGLNVPDAMRKARPAARQLVGAPRTRKP